MSIILILGGGAMQLPAITAAKELGYTVAVADGSAAVPGAKTADIFEAIDLKEQQLLLDYAQRLNKEGQVAAVFTAATDFSANVAYLNEQLGLKGHSYEAALNATNKVRMRKTLVNAGVNCPNFTFYRAGDPLEPLLAAINKWGNHFNVVVKPVDNMGARGVMQVTAPQQLAAALTNALAYSPSGEAIIEEFIDGFEFSIDSLIFDDEHIICGIADRHIYFPPYFIEMGHTMPSNFPAESLKLVLNEFKKACRALGLSWGAAKGDMKLNSKGRAVVGEIAARLSGGYMSGFTYPLSSGVNLTKETLRLALGETNLNLTPTQQLVCAERAFISIPGEVISIEELDNPRQTAGFQQLFMRAEVGKRLVFPRNNVEKAGNVLCTGESYDKAISRADKVRKAIFIRLKAGDDETKEFLQSDEGLSSAFVDGLDYNGLSQDEVAVYFKKITGGDINSLITDDNFNKALTKGSLQGAVWYFDSFKS